MVMMKKMIRVWILFFVVALLVLVCGEAVTIGEKCSNDFTKLTTCLMFATGKSDTPTKECCTSVTEIKQSEPECLCNIIQQTHNGSQQLKNMGIQESRLLHLPSACKLANASVSDCPKLLNIPSTSPDYAIFTNSSSTTSPIPSTSPDYAIFTNSSSRTSPSTVTRTSSPSTANDSSGTIRTEHVSQLIRLVTITMAIFLLLSPVEVVSTFCM